MGAAVLVAPLASSPVQAVADDDWLGVVNTYRAMSGVGPVSANADWSAQAVRRTPATCSRTASPTTRSRAIPATRAAATPPATAATSPSAARSAPRRGTTSNLWMTGPFHAIGILRHNLRTSGFGLCASSSTPTPGTRPERSTCCAGSTQRRGPRHPIVFPGNGATVPVHAFVTESPNPMHDVRVDRRRRRAADRDDAERRHRRERHADRPVRPDRDLRAPQGQRLGRHREVDPRRRQRGDRHAAQRCSPTAPTRRPSTPTAATSRGRSTSTATLRFRRSRRPRRPSRPTRHRRRPRPATSR